MSEHFDISLMQKCELFDCGVAQCVIKKTAIVKRSTQKACTPGSFPFGENRAQVDVPCMSELAVHMSLHRVLHRIRWTHRQG